MDTFDDTLWIRMDFDRNHGGEQKTIGTCLDN